MNVLIADDEKIVLEGLKYIIDWNRLGFTICQTACDGQDAFEKIKSLNPDLVLLDIRMPKMTGIEVVQAAVESGYTGKFIFLSVLRISNLLRPPCVTVSISTSQSQSMRMSWNRRKRLNIS